MLKACLYPPKGFRSFGPIRGLLYGGQDYASQADNEILKLAMIETSEALKNLDEIMSTPNLDGIYIGPADLSLAIGQKPGFDNPKGSKTYDQILNILKHAKKHKIFAGIHNASPEYAKEMIGLGFNLVTVGADQRFMSSGAKKALSILKDQAQKVDTKGY